MDKLSMAIIAMEAHVACTNERLRQAWDVIHAELVEEKFTSTNKPSAPCLRCVNCECVASVTCCSSNGYSGFIKDTAHVG